MDSTWRETETTTFGERLFPTEEAFPDQLKLFRYRMQLASGTAILLILLTFAIDFITPPDGGSGIWIVRGLLLLIQFGFFMGFRIESLRLPRLMSLVFADYLIVSLGFALILLTGKQAALFTVFHAVAVSMLLLPVSPTQATTIQSIVLGVVVAMGFPALRGGAMTTRPYFAAMLLFVALVAIVRSASSMTFALRLSEAKSRESIEEAMRKLNFLSSFDHLTRVANRSNFESVTEAAVLDARSMKQSLAYLEVDLDYFKRINDELGHQAGDAVLRAASERIAGCLRTGDQVGRMGGDEFAVLIRGASMEIATNVAERILASFKATNLKTSWGEIALSCTIGVAWYPGWGPLSSNSLMAAADTSLYEAKEAGRGRVGSIHSPHDVEVSMSEEPVPPAPIQQATGATSPVSAEGVSVEASAHQPQVAPIPDDERSAPRDSIPPVGTDPRSSMTPAPQLTGAHATEAPLAPPPHAR